MPKYNQICPAHGGNSFTVFDDGGGYCHNAECGAKFKSGSFDPDTGEEMGIGEYKTKEEYSKKPKGWSDRKDPKFAKAVFDAYDSDKYELKKISLRTMELYNCKVSYFDDGDQEAVYYAYNIDDGIPKGYKKRVLPKDFSEGTVGEMKGLFGWGLFPNKGKRVVITEGEDDCMKVQDGNYGIYKRHYPVYSIQSSVATKDLIDVREELRKFDEIVIWFDNDGPGQKATKEAAKILGYDKVKVVQTVDGVKDACDYAKEYGIDHVVWAIADAREYSPAAILNGKDLWERLEAYNNKQSVPYPDYMEGLNEKLRGIRTGEITLWTSGTGSGKSTLMREIVYHLQQGVSEETGEAWVHSSSRVGIISLEESPEEYTKKLSGMAINKNPSYEDVPMENLREGFDKVFADGDILVLDHQGSISDGSIMDHLEFMCLKGCKYLFIDHITILVSEGSDGLTGNEAIDKIMNSLLHLAKKYDVWIGLISHLRKRNNDQKTFEQGRIPSLDDIKGCLAYDTEVLSYKGRKVKVQDIKVGDKLMGPDSLPRTVMSLKTGEQRMYKVSNKTSKDYFICNENHVLTLSRNNRMFDMKVKDFLDKSKSFQVRCKQHFSEGYELDNKDLIIPPYSLGVWLGDGSKSAFRIMDASDLGIAKRVSEELNATLKTPSNRKKEYFNFVTTTKGDLLNKLRHIGVLNNKHIPPDYKFNSRENRIQLIAGLIDTDGTYSKKDRCFYFYQKDKTMAEDVKDIARSLGFYSTCRPQKITSTSYSSYNSTIYQVTISGAIDKIPCQKSSRVPPSRKRNDCLKREIIIEKLNGDKYYGFTLDGDGRFLLGNHIITHNSGSIKQISFDVIGFARNQESDDEKERNTMMLSVLKCRFTGQTGPAGKLYYNHKTGRMQADTDKFMRVEEIREI